MLKDNPDSTIVFIDDHFSSAIIYILLNCPFEYGGMGGITGVKYEAIKDFVRWSAPSDYDLDTIYAEYVPLINSLGNYYASLHNRN